MVVPVPGRFGLRLFGDGRFLCVAVEALLRSFHGTRASIGEVNQLGEAGHAGVALVLVVWFSASCGLGAW